MNEAMHSVASALRAHLAQYAQDTRLLRLSTPLSGAALVVETITGREGLSEGFQFEITALCTDASLDLDSLLGQPALLQILTQHSRSELRPVHGHVTAFELLSSDGGFARYRITLEPWLAFLRYRHDCYVWQGKSTLDIVSEILGDYAGQGKLAPAWRFALADASQYRPRDVCTQFEESDLDFVERLLAEEGLCYWFEHTGDAASGALGSHTMVIADSNAAFASNIQPEIRFHRAAAVESADSITAWHSARVLATNTLSVASWNERQAGALVSQQQSAHDNGDAPQLLSSDHSGLRHFSDSAAAERSARIHLEALEARNKTYSGESTVRSLAPATTFTLTEHPIHERDRQQGGAAAATFAVIAVTHQGRNNLSSAARTLIDQLFANSTLKGAAPAPAPLYGNRFSALRADVPWRPLTEDARGALLHPKPTVAGIHTAIVTGVAGQDIHTERDHRIKVQMHWQRGRQSASRRSHPQEDDNAPGDQSAYVWVRVMEPAAGANWGASFTPRIGQEVILDYIEGDIDRPIVIGSLYNGRGMDDAQGNQSAQGAGAATGNAPAWFAGAAGEHAHNAILSGFKTQEIGHSQSGQGGHNAMMFDDSTRQVGARLQTTHAATQLNLGHIKRQTDNARQESHGHGAELVTEAFGALRAGQGLLLSADARPNANSGQMDAKEAHSQLQQALDLQTNLAETAKKHHAFVGKNLSQQQHERPEQILKRPVESLAQSDQGSGTPQGGGAGTACAFGRPDLVLSSPAGIALLTPADAHATAAAITVTGGQDVSMTVGRNYAAAVRSGIALFTYGDARGKRADKGIRLHAAQGKVDVQAQSGELKAAADKDVSIASTHAKVEAAGKEHVLLTAGGAYVKIVGGSIQIHAPGKVQFKAGGKELSGPTSQQFAMPTLPISSELALYMGHFKVLEKSSNEPIVGKAYRMVRENGSVVFGVTDQEGNTRNTLTTKPENVRIILDRNEKFHRTKTDDDEINEWFSGEQT